jgi:hypothetical protein
MALRAAALAIAVCLLAALECAAQGVGSWRNQPGTGAIVYDGRGRRIYWDDNGQVAGRYNFHTNRYESINSRPPGVGASLANNLPENAQPAGPSPAGALPANMPILAANISPPPVDQAIRPARRALVFRAGNAAPPRRSR